MRSQPVQIYYTPIPSDFDWNLVATHLPKDTRQRISRFKFDRDRNRFAFSQFFLRKTLSEFVGCQISEVHLTVDSNGKPILETGMRVKAPIGFNLSRCQSNVAVAIGGTETIGIDVEDNTDIDPIEIANQNFSDSEIEFLESTPANLHLNQFLKLWSCKEAVTKAIGLGLAMPLNQFSICELDQDSPQVEFVDLEHGIADQWSLDCREIEPSCFLTVAVRMPEADFIWNKIAKLEIE